MLSQVCLSFEGELLFLSLRTSAEGQLILSPSWSSFCHCPSCSSEPGGAKGRGASSLDSTEASSSSTEEEEGDLQVALALKTAALRALSVKNAHLNDVLQRLRVATSTQQTEKELEDLSQVRSACRKRCSPDSMRPSKELAVSWILQDVSWLCRCCAVGQRSQNASLW